MFLLEQRKISPLLGWVRGCQYLWRMWYFIVDTLPEKEEDYSGNIDRLVFFVRTCFFSDFFLSAWKSRTKKKRKEGLSSFVSLFVPRFLISIIAPVSPGAGAGLAIEIPLPQQVRTTCSVVLFPLDWSWKLMVNTVLKRAIDRWSSGDVEVDVKVEVEVEVGGAHLSDQSVQNGKGQWGCLRNPGSPPGDKNNGQDDPLLIQTVQELRAPDPRLKPDHTKHRLSDPPWTPPPSPKALIGSSWQNPLVQIAPLVEHSELTVALRFLQGSCSELDMDFSLVMHVNGRSLAPLAVRGQQ